MGMAGHPRELGLSVMRDLSDDDVGPNQGVTKRCRLSLLTNSTLVYESQCGVKGGVAGSQPMSTAVHINVSCDIERK
jgi:hypothetical protein